MSDLPGLFRKIHSLALLALGATPIPAVIPGEAKWEKEMTDGGEGRSAARDWSRDKMTIVVILDEMLAKLDEAGATIPAAHLSLAIETLRTWTPTGAAPAGG